MAYAIIPQVHSMVKFVVRHMDAKSFAPTDVTNENDLSKMTRCTEPSDRHIWIVWDSEKGDGNAMAFYTIECRDGKRRTLTMDLAVRNGANDSFRLNEFPVRRADDWIPSIREFADWIEKTTDYDIE